MWDFLRFLGMIMAVVVTIGFWKASTDLTRERRKKYQLKRRIFVQDTRGNIHEFWVLEMLRDE